MTASTPQSINTQRCTEPANLYSINKGLILNNSNDKIVSYGIDNNNCK